MSGRVGEVEVEVGLAEGHVVGVGKAIVEELPLLVGGVVEDGLAVAGIAGGGGGCEEAVVESGEGPLRIEVGLGDAELPIGDLLHGAADGCGFEGGREVGGERAGIVGCVADDFAIDG